MFETITRDLEELGGMWTHKNLNLSFLRSKSKHKNSKPSDKTKLVFTSINFKKFLNITATPPPLPILSLRIIFYPRGQKFGSITFEFNYLSVKKFLFCQGLNKLHSLFFC